MTLYLQWSPLHSALLKSTVLACLSYNDDVISGILFVILCRTVSASFNIFHDGWVMTFYQRLFLGFLA